MQILVIGGSDAGISAALRAKELNPATEVTIVVADRYPNFSICGLPFYLSGEVPDWRSLAHRTIRDIEKGGIRLLLNHRATSMDPDSKEVSVSDGEGDTRKFSYDRLIIATGAESVRPRIEGIDLPGVFLLRWIHDAFAMEKFLNERQPRSAIIVGAGYIGMEMAGALTYREMVVSVVEFADSVLTAVDREFGKRIEAELNAHGVRASTGITVTGIGQQGGQLVVAGSKDFSAGADMVLVAVGARPQSELAQDAGVEIGFKGAIVSCGPIWPTSMPLATALKHGTEY